MFCPLSRTLFTGIHLENVILVQFNVHLRLHFWKQTRHRSSSDLFICKNYSPPKRTLPHRSRSIRSLLYLAGHTHTQWTPRNPKAFYRNKRGGVLIYTRNIELCVCVFVRRPPRILACLLVVVFLDGAPFPLCRLVFVCSRLDSILFCCHLRRSIRRVTWLLTSHCVD